MPERTPHRQRRACPAGVADVLLGEEAGRPLAFANQLAP
jgi:hypothetical protein